jgi:hypothetical protein
MKRPAYLLFWLVAVFVVIAVGCSSPTGSSASMNEIAARDAALSIADPVSGTTQELTDLGSFFYADDAAKRLGGAPWSLFHAGDFALYFMQGIESGKFVWNPTANDYELSETPDVAAGPTSGSANIIIDVAFFSSSDGSGTGEQISGLSAGLPSTIHSLSYKRQMTGTFVNSHTDTQRQLASTSSFTVTGLNSGTPGFTVNGTKTVTFTDKYADGSMVTGTRSEAVNQLVVSAVPQSDGSCLVTATGTIVVSCSATITLANGTSDSVQKTATFTLDGQQTAHFNMGGTGVDVDITTGAAE